MLSLATRKISGHRVSLALAALLLNGATASAACVDNDAQQQASALLSRGAVAAEHAVVTLSPADAVAMPADAIDQARRLLSGAPALQPAGHDGRAGAKSPDYATGAFAAYAGAQESARRMILGRGA